MIFYHGTAALNLASIKAKGLLPRAGKGGDAWTRQDPDFISRAGTLLETPERANSVYFTRYLSVAQWFADMAAKINSSKPVILQIDLPVSLLEKLVIDEEGNHEDPNFSIQLEGTIPPDLISVVPATKLKGIQHLKV